MNRDAELRGHLLLHHPLYEWVQELGMGSFGIVERAKVRETGEDVAVKLIERTADESERIQREVRNLQLLAHPHIVRFKETFEIGQHVAVVMEYMSGGNLQNYIRGQGGRLSEEAARWVFQQVICALDCMHHLELYDRDLKPANILLDCTLKPLVKICDLGLSKSLVFDGKPTTRVGSVPYMAPELVFRQPNDIEPYDGEKVDSWSIGAVLYRMVTGKRFYREDAANIEEYQEKATQQLERMNSLERSTQISNECKDLIRMIMKVEPQERPSIQGIQQHSWYQQDLPKQFFDVNNKLIAANLERMADFHVQSPSQD